jgi:hypothetical protein
MNRSIQIATRFSTAFPLGMLVAPLGQPASGSRDKEHGRNLPAYREWLKAKWTTLRPVLSVGVDRAWYDVAILDAAAWAGIDPAALHVIVRFESGYKAVGPTTIEGTHTATGPGQVTVDTHDSLGLSWPHAWDMVPWYGLCAAAATWRKKLAIAGGDVDRAWLGYTGDQGTAAARIAAYRQERA